MLPSLRSLLAEIIDYAGLFPPAQLPLAEAIQAYAGYQRNPDRWMLGRFVCPADRLEELGRFVSELFSVELPLRVAALGRGGKDAAEFFRGLQDDGAAIEAFRVRYPEQTEIAVYEVRLPGDILAARSGEAASGLLTDITRSFEQAGLLSMALYCEAAAVGATPSSVALLSAALAKENRRRAGERRLPGPAGLKLRCGGLQAGDFPSPEQVAFALTTCRDAGVPLKFTAGLHHPIRCFDRGVQAFMHGFLNVFAAGVLAHARQLAAEQVRRIIEDQDSANFAFDDDGLRWKDFRATVAEIRAARRSVVSFGSCSFEEPRGDLRALGLLP
jgi:hypothetical protein